MIAPFSPLVVPSDAHATLSCNCKTMPYSSLRSWAVLLRASCTLHPNNVLRHAVAAAR